MNNKMKIKKELLDEILDSKMEFNRKMRVMEMLDKLFRKKLGVIYLSDKEIEDNDIMNRSM